MQDWTKRLEYPDYAWTGLDKSTVNTILDSDFNPLGNRNNLEKDNPGLRELALMQDPYYLYFTARTLLNIELWPLQAVALSTLWNHAFPMLICSRGFSKTFSLAIYALLQAITKPGIKIVVSGAAFRQSKFVFDYVMHMWTNSSILRSIYKEANDGPKTNNDMYTFRLGQSIIYFIPIGCLTEESLITGENGISSIKDCADDRIWCRDKFKDVGFRYHKGLDDVIKIKTRAGFEYKGTYNHKMKVWRNDREEWIRSDEMKVGDHVLIDTSERWYNPSFDCSVDQAYALGLMIGDGSYSNQYFLRYTTVDTEFLPVLNSTIGDFKQQSDKIHYQVNGKKLRRDWLDFWGIEESEQKTYFKCLPKNLLKSSKESVAACISGIFDTDGHVSHVKGKDNSTQINLALTNTSIKLMRQIQYILTHFGIKSSIYSRQRKNYHICYQLSIHGEDILKFQKHINFRLKRKREKLAKAISSKKRWNSIYNNLPISKDRLIEIAERNRPGKNCSAASIKLRKTFTKQYIQKLYDICVDKNAPKSDLDYLYQFINPGICFDPIVDITYLKDQEQVYDFNVPDDHMYTAGGFVSHNTGEKIRGLRGNIILVDEFNSISTSIYEIVINNFGAVARNPVENLQKIAKKAALIESGEALPEELLESFDFGNQSIISGTMGYEFQPMYEYWNKYKNIINGSLGVEEGLNKKDYCIVRIPYELIPKGFMDDKTITRAKATMHTGSYNSEYGCVAVKDTTGFFKRSLIEACTCKDTNLAEEGWPEWCPEKFEAVTHGKSGSEYVMGVDPASENDNFAIIILEKLPEHNRVVYSWTTNKKKFSGGADNYYGYCAKKIRQLCKAFNIIAIGIDAQGGGIAIEEALHDKSTLEKGEVPFWPAIDKNKSKDTDKMSGSHILHMVQFANAKWTAEANHGMRKDLESKTLLFPVFNSILLGLADNMSTSSSPYSDTMEDSMLEIEELKEELSTIVLTSTATRERWDTPEVKQGNAVGKLRKDRYSALLIANMVARSINRKYTPDYTYNSYVGNGQKKKSEGLYVGPQHLVNKMPTDIFRAVGQSDSVY